MAPCVTKQTQLGNDKALVPSHDEWTTNQQHICLSKLSRNYSRFLSVKEGCRISLWHFGRSQMLFHRVHWCRFSVEVDRRQNVCKWNCDTVLAPWEDRKAGSQYQSCISWKRSVQQWHYSRFCSLGFANFHNYGAKSCKGQIIDSMQNLKGNRQFSYGGVSFQTPKSWFNCFNVSSGPVTEWPMVLSEMKIS